MRTFLLLGFCAALAACSSEPPNPATEAKPDESVAGTCLVANTGSNIPTRSRCATTTTSDNSAARDQAEAMRTQQTRILNGALARP